MLPVRRRPLRRPTRDPFEIAPLDFERLMGYWWPETAGETTELTGEYPMDMREEDNKIVVEQEMPGFKNDEIDVNVEGDVLNVTAERKTPESKGTPHLRERRYTRIQRSVTLPTTVDESKVDARLEGGVLRLDMPKAEERAQRRIKVK